MKCWLRLNSQIQKSRLIFLPEYALQNNKALALLIQAFKESNNDLNNEEEEIITKKYNSYHRNWKVFNTPFIEMSYPIKDYSVRSIYRNQVEFEEYYSYFYEQFYVIRVSTEEDDQPIAILKYNSKVQENRKIVNCKSKLRINNKIEKWHEPIAYSMRHFDSEKVYPANYKEEQRYIDKYVRNINAPIKYSEL